MDFQTAFQSLIGNEGGYSLDPHDRGNWTGGAINVGECKGTKFGISAAAYPNLELFHTADPRWFGEVPPLVLRQTIVLGGAREYVGAGACTFGIPVCRFTV